MFRRKKDKSKGKAKAKEKSKGKDKTKAEAKAKGKAKAKAKAKGKSGKGKGRRGGGDHIVSRKKKKKGKHQDQSRDDDDDEDDNSGEGRTLTVRTMKRKPSIQGLMPVASKKEVTRLYNFGDVIAATDFSTILKAKHRNTGQERAVKVVRKKRHVYGGVGDLLTNEIDILKRVSRQHAHIITTYEMFETRKDIYIVMEYVPRGDLYGAITSEGTFSEQKSARVILQILAALDYLHSNLIVHRDLKPENCLLGEEGILVTDFGLSRVVGADNVLNTACGTKYYVAPEVLNGVTYSYKIDLWAAGIILFMMIGGYPPFFDEDDAQLFNLIKKGDVRFADPYWTHVTSGAKGLINDLLQVDPDLRLEAGDAISDDWVYRTSGVAEVLAGSDPPEIDDGEHLIIDDSISHLVEETRHRHAIGTVVPSPASALSFTPFASPRTPGRTRTSSSGRDPSGGKSSSFSSYSSSSSSSSYYYYSYSYASSS